MFSSAIKINHSYTLPVVSSVRTAGGDVASGMGAYVTLNKEGWIMTAAHIMQDLVNFHQHKTEADDYQRKVEEINNQADWLEKKKRKEIAKLKVNRSWITKQSLWWGKDGMTVNQFAMDTARDIAIGRLEPFDPAQVKNYPVFRNPKNKLTSGTSLCRLGFPFHELRTTFDEIKDVFDLDPTCFPIPFFPMDGILTRHIVMTPPGQQPITFIEVSTPGLRGQSGGPIFDTEGSICGLQSKTQHFPLGFDIKVKDGARETIDRQYLHTGIGLDSEEIMKFLDAHKVTYDLAK